jgi:single-strand DNA-binding protein
MPFSTGVNRVFLLGRVGDEPKWETISGQRVSCFQISTTENIKKDGSTIKLTEWHHIKMPAETARNVTSLKSGDLVYIQGKLQTRIVFESGVKLYKTEIVVLNIEKLEFSDELMHST